MTDFDKIQAEKAEINRLIQNGLSFQIDRKLTKRGLFGKKQSNETQAFTMYEPTLAVLDRLAKEQLELDADEKELMSGNGQNEARRLAAKHAKRMARIVAIAVLGEDLFIPERVGGMNRYQEDSKSLRKLTALFENSLRPSKLIQLVHLINTMSNLGDFCNSIRLMSVNRTTMPDRIEEAQV